ncbi:UNVERIFIED_CONTAM: hypothetical protein FKN15_078001 [Acipenser sinensis]
MLAVVGMRDAQSLVLAERSTEESQGWGGEGQRESREEKRVEVAESESCEKESIGERRESSGGKDMGGERAEVTTRGDSGGRRSRERGERQRKRDEIVIREVQGGDREGEGAAGPGEGEVQLTASFVGRGG